MFQLVEFAEFFLHSLVIPYCNSWSSRRAADRLLRAKGVPPLPERYVNRFPIDFPTYLARQQLKFWPGYPSYIQACQNRIELGKSAAATSVQPIPPVAAPAGQVDSPKQEEPFDNISIPGSFTELVPKAVHRYTTETISPEPTRVSEEDHVARWIVSSTPELPSLPPAPRRGLGAAMRAERKRIAECTKEVVEVQRPPSTANLTADAGVDEDDLYESASPHFSDVHDSADLHNGGNAARILGSR